MGPRSCSRVRYAKAAWPVFHRPRTCTLRARRSKNPTFARMCAGDAASYQLRVDWAISLSSLLTRGRWTCEKPKGIEHLRNLGGGRPVTREVQKAALAWLAGIVAAFATSSALAANASDKVFAI